MQNVAFLEEVQKEFIDPAYDALDALEKDFETVKKEHEQHNWMSHCDCIRFMEDIAKEKFQQERHLQMLGLQLRIGLFLLRENEIKCVCKQQQKEPLQKIAESVRYWGSHADVAGSGSASGTGHSGGNS